MKYAIVSVRDSALAAYGRPLIVPSIGIALRSFTDEVNRIDPTNEMSKHPEDFELFELGSFDDASGTLFSLEKPKPLVTGKQVQTKKD